MSSIPVYGEVYFIQTIAFETPLVSNLRRAPEFLLVLQFYPPIQLTITVKIKYQNIVQSVI